MNKKDIALCIFLWIVFAILFVVPLFTSCSVLAISAGKAANTITQTTSTTTTTRLDSISVLPNYKNSKK